MHLNVFKDVDNSYPPITNMTMENHHFSIGDTSSNGWFSIVIVNPKSSESRDGHGSWIVVQFEN